VRDRPRPPSRMLRLAGAALVLAWSLGPIVLVVLSSFKRPLEIFAVPFQLVFTPTLESYRALWRGYPEFAAGLWNSLVVTAGAALVAVLAAFAAGYAFARAKGGFYAGSGLFMLVVRMLPPIVVTLPLFPVVNALGLNDTHLLLVLLYAAFYVSLGSWMMRSFIARIPLELEEAAAIDGASLLQLLRLVIFPLAAQGLVAVTLFVVVFAWNEYVFAMIFTTSEARTAPVVIGEMLSTAEGVQWGAVFAAATLQLLPVLLAVVGLQRFLVAGLTAGAVKG